MWISNSEYQKMIDARTAARQDAQDAYDRLDSVLGENERLLSELSKANERLEMVNLCLTETLREALGIGQSPRTEAHIDAAIQSETPEMPKAIREAIDHTFPGDQAIRQVNESYAYSQRHRWDSETAEIVDEIANGVTV